MLMGLGYSHRPRSLFQAARDIGLSDFHASGSWLKNFKDAHSIVSRKINKVVTAKQLRDDDALIKSADDFVAEIREEMATIGPENVLNSDQSGFNLEMRSGRTQTYRGKKRA